MSATDTVVINSLYKIKPLVWKRIRNSKWVKEWRAVLPVGYAQITEEIHLKVSTVHLFIHKGQSIKPTSKNWYPKLGNTCWCESVESAKKKAQKVYLKLLLPFLDTADAVTDGPCKHCARDAVLVNGICEKCYMATILT